MTGWERRSRSATRRAVPPAFAFLCGAVLCDTIACGASGVEDPRGAATAFAHAAATGQADALYEMLNSSGRAALSRADVKRLVLDEQAELVDAARAFSAPDARARATARLRFADGEEVALEWSAGTFGVTGGGTLPGGGPTPEAALGELRRALARRNYPALIRLLSPATRNAIEQDLRTLVGGLEHPETLPIRTTGDTSSAVVPGGHHVTLKREGGNWRVEDFD